MKKMVWVAAFLMTAMSTGICAASEISNASLHKLLVLSGIDEQSKEIPASVQANFERLRQQVKQQTAAGNKPSLSDDDLKAMEHIAVRAFDPEGFIRATATQVRRSVSEQDARAMLVWYDSRIGKKINKAEEDASTPEAYRKIVASARQLLADKPRVRFAREMDKLLHETDTMAELQENTTVAMAVAFWTARHPDQPAPIKAIKQKIEASLKQARPRIEQMTIISSVYTYRNIDMASLHKYLAFLKTPAAMRFDNSQIIGLEAGAGQAIGKLARDTVAFMANKQHSQKI